MPLLPSTTLLPSAGLLPSGFAVSVLPQRTITELGLVSAAEEPCNPDGNLVVFNNGVSVWLEWTNTDSVPQSVILVIPYSVDGQPIPDLVIALGPGQRHCRGPFDITVYGPSVAFQASSPAVTVACFQIIPRR